MAITAAGISATKAAFDLIKSLREALGRPEVDPGDIQARLVELQSLMLDAQRALADSDSENRDLKLQLEEATRKTDFGTSFTFQHGVYWRENYPYCPICWDTKKQPTRLSGPIHEFPAGPGLLLWSCSLDKGQFPLPRNAGK